jgi:hypothetical protein
MWPTRAPFRSFSVPTTILRAVPSESDAPPVSFWDRFAQVFSQGAAVKASRPYRKTSSDQERSHVQLVTLLRVGIPSTVAGIVATLTFPALSLGLATLLNDAGVFAVLSQDASQFVQNFLTVAGLLFRYVH